MDLEVKEAREKIAAYLGDTAETLLRLRDMSRFCLNEHERASLGALIKNMEELRKVIRSWRRP